MMMLVLKWGLSGAAASAPLGDQAALLSEIHT